MSGNWKHIILMMVAIGFASLAYSQSHIKTSVEADKTGDQKLARFNNRDLLIGSTYFKEGLQDGATALQLTRIDHCGDVVWSNLFEIKGVQLWFRDVIVNSTNEVFVLATYIEGLRESIFIMRLDESGIEQNAKAFGSEAVGASSFSISLHQDQLLISGRLLEIGAATTGYFAIFNSNLRFLWGKKIRPFTFEGKSDFTKDGEIIIRTEGLHFKFDRQGSLLWSQRFNFDLPHQPNGGPHLLEGGYLFQAHNPDESFFYKLDESGNLLWSTSMFSSGPSAASISQKSNLDLEIYLTATERSQSYLQQIILSADGEVKVENTLNTGMTLPAGTVHTSLDGQNVLDLVVRDDALSAHQTDLADAYIQFPLDTESNECMMWDGNRSARPNPHTLAFIKVDPEIQDLIIVDINRGRITMSAAPDPLLLVCGTQIITDSIEIDTLLGCNQDWQVELPSADFEWTDNTKERFRILKDAGIYEARNADCLSPIVLQFELKRPDCDCRIYLPNAFSPNGDGLNDVLKFSSDCQVQALETKIFDRWGNIIFSGTDLENVWDGTVPSQEASPGLYIVAVDYRLTSTNGGLLEGIKWQDVLLLK